MSRTFTRPASQPFIDSVEVRASPIDGRGVFALRRMPARRKLGATCRYGDTQHEGTKPCNWGRGKCRAFL